MTRMPITPLEIRRQIFHISLGWVLVFLLHFGYVSTWHLFGILLVGILLSFLSLRFRIPVVAWFLDRFERKQVRPGKGAITYFIGAILALELFDFDVALASILILAVGDGVSSLVGPFGKIRTRLSDKKLLEGTLVGASLGGLSACLFVSPLEGFLAAFLAMTFEAMEIRFNQQLMNDNIVVPLVAGTVMMLLRHFGVA